MLAGCRGNEGLDAAILGDAYSNNTLYILQAIAMPCSSSANIGASLSTPTKLDRGRQKRHAEWEAGKRI